MSKTILITGGAGFIGSHLADGLLARGYRVRALDCLAPQVHGNEADRPEYLDEEVELIRGDVRDRAVVHQALRGVDAVYHFAAAVGVGQSMYQIAQYTATNNLGTAVLLEALADMGVERLIVASSMSIYGEGLYQGPDGQICSAPQRTLNQLKTRQWEMRNNRDELLTPLPTPEDKPPVLASVYALSKYDQERLCLMVGAAYEIPTIALRLFNVYGTRQALSNPYTGVLAIFASRLLNDRPPMIFEDGLQRRDFVSVHDVVQACLLSLDTPEAAGQVFNIGSGHSSTVLEVAERLAAILDKQHVEPEISGKYRVGDIRHCFADISLAQRLLGYQPRMSLERGLIELAQWLQGQVAHDRVAEAREELDVRGLAI